MPNEWNAKSERQYEHVKQSELEQGRSLSSAKEIAARTVNKQRRNDGETPNITTQGTGNPNTMLADRSRRELYNRSKELKIKGRSKMNKSELIKAIQLVS